MYPEDHLDCCTYRGPRTPPRVSDKEWEEKGECSSGTWSIESSLKGNWIGQVTCGSKKKKKIAERWKVIAAGGIGRPLSLCVTGGNLIHSVARGPHAHIYAFKTQEALAVKFKMVESLFPLFSLHLGKGMCLISYCSMSVGLRQTPSPRLLCAAQLLKPHIMDS